MPVFVTPEDVAAGWRPLTEAETGAAEELILRATVLLGVKVPNLDAKPDAIVKLVIESMVRRVLKNPDGYRIRNESIDDYTDGGTIDSSLSTGELYVSDEELTYFGVRGAGRAFEIRLGGS